MQSELPKTYRLSPSGRQTTLSLMVGTVVLWITVIWLFGTTLSWGKPVPDGYGASDLVPAALLLTLVIALPLLGWSLCEEWATRYVVTESGLGYATLGPIRLEYPWAALHGLQQIDPQADAAVDVLVVDGQYIRQIRSGVWRGLHQLAFGRSRIPLYAGVEERAELLAWIQRFSELEPAAAVPGVSAAH